MALRNAPQDLELCFHLVDKNLENNHATILFETVGDDTAYASVAWKPTVEQEISAMFETNIFDIEDDIEPDPREYIFLVDRSGSMHGDRMESAKNTLKLIIQQLPTENTYFDVVR